MHLQKVAKCIYSRNNNTDEYLLYFSLQWNAFILLEGGGKAKRKRLWIPLFALINTETELTQFPASSHRPNLPVGLNASTDGRLSLCRLGRSVHGLPTTSLNVGSAPLRPSTVLPIMIGRDHKVSILHIVLQNAKKKNASLRAVIWKQHVAHGSWIWKLFTLEKRGRTQ